MRLSFGPQDIVGIVRRRALLALVVGLSVFTVAAAYIRSLPPVYESRAKLIVEDQQVRNEYVASAVESDALTRVEAVAARLLARDSLLELAAELGIFRGDALNATQRAELMRANTTVAVQRVESTRRRTDPSNIIISIAYRSPSPVQAQQVSNRLLTAFAARSVELRSDIAGGTTEFLRAEEEKMTRQLDVVLNQIAQIKEQNPTTLPENREVYQRALERAEAEKARLDAMAEQTSQELRLLQLQRPILVQADTRTTPQQEELRQKRRQLEALQREYQDSYPDVISLKEEVLALERDLDPAAFRRRATTEVANLDRQISTAARGSAAHSALIARREQLNADLANVPASTSNASLSEIQYDAQVTVIQSRIASLTSQRGEIAGQIAQIERQLASTPLIGGQLSGLEGEQQRLEAELVQIRTNRAEAERSASLEEQSKGERLTVLEQPNRPDDPVSPDRPRMLMLALLAAAGLAGLAALLPEVLFARVQTKQHIAEAFPGISVISVPRFGPAPWKAPVPLALTGVALVTSAGLALMSAYFGASMLF